MIKSKVIISIIISIIILSICNSSSISDIRPINRPFIVDVVKINSIKPIINRPIDISNVFTTSKINKPVQSNSIHIEYTNKDVTIGDSISYINTVGQCPFYEITNEKGCNPPSDIRCNNDWSNCEYVGDKK